MTDASVYLGLGDAGIVEKVLETKIAFSGKTNESQRVIYIKIREMNKPRAGDKCACFTADTEVLTKGRGWISIRDVTKEDLVASLDNGVLQYVHPEATMEYDYEGDMYQLKSNQVDLFTTPNHNLYVKSKGDKEYKLRRADEVYGHPVKHKTNAKNHNEDEKRQARKNIKNKDILNHCSINEFQQWMLEAEYKLHDDEDKYTHETQESWVHYQGKVYCCTVPSGVIYVRLNMKPVWCGNSRYAQKGTIGAILPEVDMPFVMSGPNQGMRPDIIINPAAIPSRMTNGKLIEIVASKAAALEGKRINATAFRPFQVEDFMSTLWTNGFNSKGNEMMANGMTGKPFQSLIFSGPCYYQVLKHYVKHKMQVRSRGVKNALTQQPIPGRARGGAIKFEEMIRDACVSHGVANVLREKFEHSDASRQIVCVNCKYLSSTANVNAKCRNCGEASYANVSMPYSAKLLINQLAAAGIMIMTATQPLEKPNTDFITKNPIP
jgi:hypothetical protein